jgi:hypothetical protein
MNPGATNIDPLRGKVMIALQQEPMTEGFTVYSLQSKIWELD